MSESKKALAQRKKGVRRVLTVTTLVCINVVVVVRNAEFSNARYRVCKLSKLC